MLSATNTVITETEAPKVNHPAAVTETCQPEELNPRAVTDGMSPAAAGSPK